MTDKTSPLSVALIGFGAIGREIHRRLADVPEAALAQVLLRPERTPADREPLSVVHSVADIDPGTALVVECAGHGAVAAHGAAVLERGMDLAIASVGALADAGLRGDLDAAARNGGARLIVLPGAIGGTDALAAAGATTLETVQYTGRKPPLSWRGTPAEAAFDLAGLTEATCIFEGTAAQSAKLYPKNANVVATVALAGLGFDMTRVRLIADPDARGNSHRIEAHGPLLEVDYTTLGQPLPDNPRSSALTALSAVRLIRNRAGHLVV